MFHYVTVITEIYTKILSYLNEKELLHHRLLSKEIYMSCSRVYKEKILEIYPLLPIPNNISTSIFYYNVKYSYVELKQCVLSRQNKEMLDWLEIPKNKINLLLESSFMKTYLHDIDDIESNYLFSSIENYFVNGLRPRQKTVNMIIESHHIKTMSLNSKSLYLKIIDLLVKFNIFPSQECINQLTTHNCLFMLNFFAERGIFPEQKYIILLSKTIDITGIMNILTPLGFSFDEENLDSINFKPSELKRELASNKNYTIVSQNKINSIFKDSNDELINLCCLNNKFPDQETVNNIGKKNHYSLLKLLGKHFIFPDQETINYATENNLVWTINALVGYGRFPDQKYIDIAYKKDFKSIINILSKYNLYPNA